MASKKSLIDKSQASIRSSTSASASTKNLTWWDTQLKRDLFGGKPKDLTYKEIALKHRLQRRSFRSSLSMSHMVLLSKCSSSKSFHRVQPFGPKIKKFMTSTKKTACVWRTTPRVYKMNPVDVYEKCQDEMRVAFIDSYNNKIKSENKNIENLFNRIISTDVDPLQISDTVKVSCNLVEEVPDATVKKLCRPKMARSEVITRLIHHDIDSLTGKKQASAFGTTLGKPKSKMHKYDFKTKYVNFAHNHPELESFQSVFEGISELETTKKFRAWLRKNSHIEPPAYLARKDAVKGHEEDHMKSRSKTCHDLLLADLIGYSEFNEATEFYDALYRHRSQFSVSSGSTPSSISSPSMNSFDISDINIII